MERRWIGFGLARSLVGTRNDHSAHSIGQSCKHLFPEHETILPAPDIHQGISHIFLVEILAWRPKSAAK
jgi:hypothetical protein